MGNRSRLLIAFYGETSMAAVNATQSLGYLDRLSIYIPLQLQRLSSESKLINEDGLGFFILVSLAVLCVVIGSFGSLSKPRNALEPNDDMGDRWHPTDNDGSDSYIMSRNDLKDPVELTMSSSDARIGLALHIVASCATFYSLKVFSKCMFEKVFNYGLLLLSFPSSLASINICITPILKFIEKVFNVRISIFRRFRISFSNDIDNYPLGFLEKIDRDKYKDKIKMLQKQGSKVLPTTSIKAENQILNLFLDLRLFACIPLAFATSYLFYIFNPGLNFDYDSKMINWLVGDLIALNFCIGGILLYKCPSFKFGFPALFYTLLYDFNLSFCSDDVVTMIAKLQMPLKFVIPKIAMKENINSIFDLSSIFSSQIIMEMQNVIIPGSVVALCLRFDLFRYHDKEPRAFHFKNQFPKPYFITGLVSYVAGLFLTIVASRYSKAGKLALSLEYVAPSMFLSIIVVSVWRREFHHLWKYSESVNASNTKSENANDDDDDDYSIGEESEWEGLVEEQLEIDESYAEDTDLDDIELLIQDQSAPVRIPITYEFESDDDDDTFIIDSGSSSIADSDSEDLHDDSENDSTYEYKGLAL